MLLEMLQSVGLENVSRNVLDWKVLYWKVFIEVLDSEVLVDVLDCEVLVESVGL